MSDNALSCIASRSNPYGVTERRINSIIQYIVYCYDLQLKGQIKYSKSNKKSKQKFEDHLKTKLVDEYLRSHKDYFKSINSGIEDIFFGKEETELFTDDSNIEKEDRIDICIKEIGLQRLWASNNTDEVYFAVECKRIEKLSDTKAYVFDIQKMAARQHVKLRLPFEGMMAFIEEASINHSKIAVEINKRLSE